MRAQLEICPDRGTYRPGQMVRLRAASSGEGRLRVVISHLTTLVAELEAPLENGRATIEWRPPAEAPAGYGVDAELVGAAGMVTARAGTAFDVLAHWTERPRYGFVSDFPPGRDDINDTLDGLLPFHINALQFYDWQYRHDRLVAPTEEYDDPLGRRLSVATVRRFIEAAHDRGMAAMAYTAVYAASVSFWQDHPDWALYDGDGQPLSFGDDFLGYMDPRPEGPWADHLLAECDRALELGFDGIHLDQYGEPREAFDLRGDKVDLPRAYAGFVTALKHRHPKIAVTHNAVKNWPIEELARSPQDFAYIELWPDTPTYDQVWEMALDAGQIGNKRPVVIALYVPADRPANIRMVDATILATGATRIELGERARLLTDPYFPNHQALPSSLLEPVRRSWDIAVRYGDLFGQQAMLATGPKVTTFGGVRTVVRETDRYLAVSFLNIGGLADPARWDSPHDAPRALEGSSQVIGPIGAVTAAWWVDPDDPSPEPMALRWTQTGDEVAVMIPSISYWGLLFLELGPKEVR